MLPIILSELLLEFVLFAGLIWLLMLVPNISLISLTPCLVVNGADSNGLNVSCVSFFGALGFLIDILNKILNLKLFTLMKQMVLK